MLLRLTKQVQHGLLFSKNLQSQRQNIIDKLKPRLSNLMQSDKRVLAMAKLFHIFPSYFSTRYVNQMMKSPFLDEYVDYILLRKEQNNQNQNHKLTDVLWNLGLSKIEDQRMMEVYVNYIKRTQDLSESEMLMQIFDIRNPENWFKSKLVGQRKFVYHHGPTNSGKTFSAVNQLKNLKPDQKGVYMAPLRLLAWQTQKKLGKCNLITGQEKDYQNSNVTSCTIEAVKLSQFFDVAVIDQIQMIGDSSRGWSWTAPILGLKADRIHLCGDERALGLISELIDKSGGTLQEKSYARLSKLHLVKKIFKISDIQPGDCLIQFSSQKLYQLRNLINQTKGTQSQPAKTAIIYGKMPPTCRKAQAQKFNSGQLPYLVASDAIGMGLNLKIRRIVFVNLMKLSHDKMERFLEDHQIRQIAGRAGRGYGHGYVQCMNGQLRDRVRHALRNVGNIIQEQSFDKLENINTLQKDNSFEQSSIAISPMPSDRILDTSSSFYNKHLNRYLRHDEKKVQRAGIFFPNTIIERIKVKMERIQGKELRISETIRLITYLSKENKDLFFVEANQELMDISDELEHFKLPFNIHFLFAQIPIPNNSSRFKKVVIKYGEEFMKNGCVRLPEDLIKDYENGYAMYQNLNQIKFLQDQFFIAQAYTWLWNHLQLYFPDNELSIKAKQAICLKMNQLLQQPNYENDPKKIKKIRRNNFNKQEQNHQYLVKNTLTLKNTGNIALL